MQHEFPFLKMMHTVIKYKMKIYKKCNIDEPTRDSLVSLTKRFNSPRNAEIRTIPIDQY